MIYILYGEDSARMELKLESLKKKYKDHAYTRMDTQRDSMDAFLELTDSMSLFSEPSLIVLDNADFLSASPCPGYSLEEIAKRDPEDKVLVYMVPSKKLDGRKKLVKALEQKATLMECLPLDEKSAPDVIASMLKERNLAMDKDAFEWFYQHAGYNSMRLAKELDKMKLYSDRLNLEDVKALTTVEPLEDVFKMTSALFNKQGMLLLSYYRNFRSLNMEPVAINGLLSGQIRFVYQVRVLMDQKKNKNEIARILNASPGRIYNSMKNAGRFSAEELLSHLASLADLDQMMKSGRIDKDEGFESFIMEMIIQQHSV